MLNLNELILKFALQNAWKFGKAKIDAVISKVIGEQPEAKSQLKTLIPDIKKIVADVNKKKKGDIEKQLQQLAPELMEEKKLEEQRTLPPLLNVKGPVVMRLAPFPSGALHIGNARPAILNDEYVKRYKGKLLLIIDDTIGSEEKTISKEAYNLIPESIDWLGVAYEKNILYKSDRLDLYYKYAEEIIKKDKAYVCTCKAEILRENRAQGKDCSCRSQNTKNNLDLFKKMFTMKPGEAALRIKTSMQDKNPAFRDRVLFRISDREHPRVGKKYRVWPLLEFSWAIDDYVLGMTHILRGKELMIETEMERYIWNIFGWPDREVIHTGLFAIEGVKISKSKSRQEVDSGEYAGWDDPRTWSLQSLKKRGFKPEAIRNFCLGFGVTQTEIKVPVDALYAENRKLIEKDADRYAFVENPAKIVIKNAPSMTTEAPLHPEIDRGKRIYTTGQEFYIEDKLDKKQVYRFMHLFNFKDNQFISTELDQSLKAKMIHWLPVSKELLEIEVLMPDGTKKKGLGDPNLKNVKEGQVIQFERKFFACLNKKTKSKYEFSFTHQ